MKLIPAVLPIALLLGGTGLAHGQATVKPDGQFRSVVGLGASASSGNADATHLSITGDGVRATERDKTTVYGNLQYARTEGETTAEQLRLGGRQDRNLAGDLFVFGGLDFERNRFSNLRLRSQLSGGPGWHVIKSPATTFDVFGGLAYTNDSYFDAMLIDGRSRRSYGYMGLLLGEESTHKLSATTSAKQRLTVLPNLSNSGEWRASWNGGIAVAMTNVLSLTVGLTVAYNGELGPGRKKTDTLFTTGLSVRFD